MYIPLIGKKSKITPVPTVFLLRHYQSTNHQKIVPPKNTVGTGVILLFLRRRCPSQCIIVKGLKIGMKVQSDRLICTWGYDF